MLNPNNDRLDYGQILSPPAGYYLDFAVGTTYSLDLDALVGASLALGLSVETDSNLVENPVCLLEALRSTSDNVALFCEGGQIHLPSKVTELYVLLEKMVFTAQAMKKRGRSVNLPAFHPKVWLIRFIDNDGDAIYRVVVLSRNLTFDRSWDVSFYMDGKVIGQYRRMNLPMCDFLQYLVRQLPSDENAREKAKRIRSLIRELPYVRFSIDDKRFLDYEFIPVGIKDEDGYLYRMEDTDLFEQTFHEIFIMSPFLTGDVISDFNNRNYNYGIKNPQYYLITRETALGMIKPEDVSNFKLFTMRGAVIDGETSVSEDEVKAQRQDIHAKLYMKRKHSNADLYLGSLNATHSALNGNVEFMIKLSSQFRYLNTYKLTKALFGEDKDGKDNPFQEVTMDTILTSDNNGHSDELDRIVKAISRSKPEAEIKENGDSYNVRVFFESVDTKGCDVEIRPLLSQKTKKFDTEICFERLELVKLSEFYVITVSNNDQSVSRVIKIQTKGMPDGREKAVVSSVINDRDCFYRYIAFLLGDDKILGMLDANEIDLISEAQRRKQQADTIPPLYEKMLKTAATSPEKFKGIEYLLKTISEDGVIPEDFKRLFETFKRTVDING